MDLDALQTARAREWARLDELSSSRRLNGAQVDELVARYQSASADFADIKTTAGRTPQGDAVSVMLARARLRLTGAPENILRLIPRFFAVQLPAALYRVRWATLVVALVSLLIMGVIAAWIAGDPAVMRALGPEDQLKYYAEHDFVDYYSDNPTAVFAGMVWTNNAWLAAQCVLFGITGLWPLYVIMSNAVNVGISMGVMIAFGHAHDLLYLLPHGLLELTSIFVAAAAGLQIFWSLVSPGPRTRLEAVARAGSSLGTVAIGLILSLALSGFIEGFITRQAWPWPAKIGIGALALGVFLFYMLVVGGRAAKAGDDGGLTEYEGGTTRLVAG
ncbi:MAG: stage II sporulation protein M [Microbacterium sp.]